MFPPAPPPFELRQGPCFRYALPQGWQVVEDAQFALALRSPEEDAVTLMVGNAGLPLMLPPGQYLWDQLARMQLEGLRLGPPRLAPPVLGFPHAWEHEAEYAYRGVPCRGLAKVSAAPGYDSVTLVVTWAASHAARWPWYAPWLPGLASRVEVTSGAAFGMMALARQNLTNSIALGEQARAVREWSAAQWDQVVREREGSQARNQFELGQALAGVERRDDPVSGRQVDLSAANAVYWVHPATGRIVGSPDPSFDPRTPTDADWRPMPRSAPPG